MKRKWRGDNIIFWSNRETLIHDCFLFEEIINNVVRTGDIMIKILVKKWMNGRSSSSLNQIFKISINWSMLQPDMNLISRHHVETLSVNCHKWNIQIKCVNFLPHWHKFMQNQVEMKKKCLKFNFKDDLSFQHPQYVKLKKFKRRDCSVQCAAGWRSFLNCSGPDCGSVFLWQWEMKTRNTYLICGALQF